MPVDDQSEAIDALSRPETYGLHVAVVERIETHAAIVFLAGHRAYKLKRAVKFSYLDYSTLALRRRFCMAELSLNRRTAPDLYLAVQSLNRDFEGRTALDGAGPAMDYVVVMRRFDQADLLDHLAAQDGLSQPLMLDLAERIARFHGEAAPVFDAGGSDGLAEVIADNARNLEAAGLKSFDPAAVAAVNEGAAAVLRDCAALLDRRRQSGRVRHCHGDLHLRNICLIEGRPTLFDSIEFSRRLACIDTLYDLAFLLMDLCHRRLGVLANGVLNRYLDVSDDSCEGLAALPLFLSARAAIRAHVEAAAGRQSDPSAARQRAEGARSYLAMARDLLRPAPPMLVAVGGLSGSGKSTLAYALAPTLGPPPGARVLRSDVLRKKLMGVSATTALPGAAYAPDVTEQVYAMLRREAAVTLAAGHSVIVDAVFAHASERDAVRTVAQGAGAEFVGFWLDAPAEVLAGRIAARRGDASDATVAVLRRQLQYDIGPLDWSRLDASAEAQHCRTNAQACLARRAKPAPS